MTTLMWVTDHDGGWCRLETVDLTDVRTTGVYIIWHEGTPGRVVRIGQGDIAERLTAERGDRDVLGCGKAGTLRVTWAYVPANQLDGIERYLVDQLMPLVGDGTRDVLPMAVNSPW